MDKTATVNTICPHPSPAAKGTEPIAAWTVALGQYAIMQNKRSDFANDVFNKQINTPSILNKSTPNINRIAITPAFNA